MFVFGHNSSNVFFFGITTVTAIVHSAAAAAVNIDLLDLIGHFFTSLSCYVVLTNSYYSTIYTYLDFKVFG